MAFQDKPFGVNLTILPALIPADTQHFCQTTTIFHIFSTSWVWVGCLGLWCLRAGAGRRKSDLGGAGCGIAQEVYAHVESWPGPRCGVRYVSEIVCFYNILRYHILNHVVSLFGIVLGDWSTIKLFLDMCKMRPAWRCCISLQLSGMLWRRVFTVAHIGHSSMHQNNMYYTHPASSKGI